MKNPGPVATCARTGALHKTALNSSRLPPAPDGPQSYKIPANRDKTAHLRATSAPPAAQRRFGPEPTTKRRRSTRPASPAASRPSFRRPVRSGAEQLQLVRPGRRFAGHGDGPGVLGDRRRGGRERRLPATCGQADWTRREQPVRARVADDRVERSADRARGEPPHAATGPSTAPAPTRISSSSLDRRARGRPRSR